MSVLKYEYTETGYCRVYYSFETADGKKFWFCAQDEGGGGVVFYQCTAEPWCEPSHEFHLKDAPPLSPGNDSTDKAVNEWITNKWGVKDEAVRTHCD